MPAVGGIRAGCSDKACPKNLTLDVTAACIVAAYIAGLVLGHDFRISGGVTMFTSYLHLAALLSFIVASKIMENLGQKLSMILGVILFCSGIKINFATRNILILIVSRIFLGFGIGFTSQVFATKWQSIRTKIADLNSGLVADENCDSNNNPGITECGDLARRFVDLSFADTLVCFLRNGEVSVQKTALKIIVRLSATSKKTKKALGDAGIMQDLVKFLESESFEFREMAVEALSEMVLVARNRKRFVRDDKNIGLILQLLDPEQKNSGNNKKLLLSILIALTRSRSGRRKISSSGHLKNVEKLAEAEIYVAKKLLKKLSTNRLKSLFRGIWHC